MSNCNDELLIVPITVTTPFEEISNQHLGFPNNNTNISISLPAKFFGQGLEDRNVYVVFTNYEF